MNASRVSSALLSFAAAAAATLVTAPVVHAAPGAPENVSATGEVNAVSVVWDAPSGGKPTGYDVECADSSGAVRGKANVRGTARSATVKPLAGGVSYTCSVSAKDAEGSSQPSIAPTVTVLSVPAAPQLNGITPGGETLTLSFTPPANTGGLPVVQYWATCGSTSVYGAASPIVVELPNVTTAVSCSVKARNAIGLSAASNSMSAAPGRAPKSTKITKITVPATGSFLVTATSSTPNAAPVNSWTVTCLGSSGDTVSGTGASSPITVTGTRAGFYSCSAVAANIYGPSDPSLPYGPVQAIPVLNAPAAPSLTWKRNSKGAAVTASFERYAEADSYALVCKSGKKIVKASTRDTSATFTVVPGVWGCTLAAQVGQFSTPVSAEANTSVTPAVPKTARGKGTITLTRPAGLERWTAQCTPEKGKAKSKTGSDTTVTFSSLPAGKYTCLAKGNGLSSDTTVVTVK